MSGFIQFIVDFVVKYYNGTVFPLAHVVSQIKLCAKASPLFYYIQVPVVSCFLVASCPVLTLRVSFRPNLIIHY